MKHLYENPIKNRVMPNPNQLGMAVRPVAVNTLKLNNNNSQTLLQKIG